MARWIVLLTAVCTAAGCQGYSQSATNPFQFRSTIPPPGTGAAAGGMAAPGSYSVPNSGIYPNSPPYLNAPPYLGTPAYPAQPNPPQYDRSHNGSSGPMPPIPSSADSQPNRLGRASSLIVVGSRPRRNVDSRAGSSVASQRLAARVVPVVRSAPRGERLIRTLPPRPREETTTRRPTRSRS